MTMTRRRRHDDLHQDGVAILMALLLVLIGATLTLTLLAYALSETRDSARADNADQGSRSPKRRWTP
jgi:type II secretory pathway component PulK